MAGRRAAAASAIPLRVVVLTLDGHLADALGRARTALVRELPGLDLAMHVAADFMDDAGAAERCRADVARAHVVVCAQLWTEELARAVTQAVADRRAEADAVCCVMCAPELMRLNKLGRFGGGEGEGGWSPLALLRRLRGDRGAGRSAGERQLNALRALPKLLRFVPGAAQDVRAFMLAMQYWLAGTDGNVANLVRMLVARYAAGPRAPLRDRVRAGDPEVVPEVGVWHPDLPGHGIVETAGALPRPRGAMATVGLLVGRSYLLAGNTAHYAAVVRALEARGLAVLPAFASALDATPAVERYMIAAGRRGAPAARVEALVNLTGFALVGGPAYSDAGAAQALLARLDVPYLGVQALEFQTVEAWDADARGLAPLQATLQVAIPELDGATGPVVYGGRTAEGDGASVPVADRVAMLADRVARLVALRRSPRAERRVGIVLFNFPPNAGNTGSAAYLAVFESLQRTLAAMKEAGYTVELPASVDELRRRVCEGNAARFGAPANVHVRMPADDHVRREPHLAEIERAWGSAPGRQLSDGASLFVLGERFGNVFVGVQPAFGWEGDPMRLLFESGFAPTHAFSAFYRWLREDFAAHAVLHFGTHGALEFMPGKQVGLSGRCWPDRLIGDLPNVYLYASNNSSEGTLARRRGAATLVSYLTPPIARAGLYKGLADLRGTLDRHRGAEDDAARAELASLAREQAAALELAGQGGDWDGASDREVEALRARLLELEYTLIPTGLHVVGGAMAPEARTETLGALAMLDRPDLDLPSLPEALRGAASAVPDAAGPDADVAALVAELVATRDVERVASRAARAGLDGGAALPVLRELRRIDDLLAADHELPGILRALDARWIPPAPGGDLLRSPAVLPTGRNVYGFDPYRVPSPTALLEGRRRAELLLARHAADGHGLPGTVAMVLWGSDNMKSDGAPLATALALLGAAPRFDAVGRLAGARLVPLAQLGRPRVDVVLTLSGIFRDLLPLQVRLLAEAAALAAAADEAESDNFVRMHALAAMRETGCTLEEASLRVFGNADGAYGSNVNLLVESGRWEEEDELAEQFVRRKGFAYDRRGACASRPDLMRRLLGHADLAAQNLDSVELGTVDIDQYVESLGGVSRAIARERGRAAPTYLSDHTTAGPGAVRTLGEQVALETRTRTLNPRWYEAQLAHGYEGARNVASRVTTTLGWSATTGEVPQWVYAQVGETFVLDPAMRERLARLNPGAASGMAQRLLEATDRGFWTPDADTLARLHDAAADLEDRLEGVTT